MAQLKDLIVNGSSRFIGPTYGIDLSEIENADDLKAIEALSGTSGFLQKENNTWSLTTGVGTGTVTSVTIKGTSPIVSSDETAITSSGTRTISHANSGVTAASYGDTTDKTPGYGETFKVPSFTVNSTGHLTVAGEHTVKIPAAPTVTDTKVKQTAGSTNADYPILASAQSSPTSGTAYEAIYDTDVSINPSTGELKATKLNGSTIGNNPKFTDTVYSLPLAANGTRGGIQIGYTESGTNYAVKLSSEKAYVTVPWTDTHVTGVSTHYTPTKSTTKSASGATGTSGSTVQVVTGIEMDGAGHVTGVVSGAATDTDTKNTAGSTDTSSKIYLVGATSQAANPQTYSDNEVYATNGQLDAKSFRVATTSVFSYNTTTGCLEITT